MMKSFRTYLFTGIIFLISISVYAQVTLPYYTGFDDATQKTGWTEFKKGATTFSHWGYASFNAYSTPECISHDYSPSTGITLTDNWFVSPSFSITNGGMLDSIRYRFSGFSQPTAGDTIAIYLLVGSQDPSLATSKTLLLDFRNSEYITDNTYRLKTNITLAATNELCYLAIRYRNSDCSSNWLSVAFDNIAIRGNNVGINEIPASTINVSIYPNPASGKVFINCKQKFSSVEIYNLIGEKVYTASYLIPQTFIEIDLSGFQKGVYFVRVFEGNKVLFEKLVFE